MLHLSIFQKYFSLLLTALLIAAGVIAQNKFSGYLADHTTLCKRKTIVKTEQSAPTKLALLEDHLIIDKEIKLEDWMFHFEFVPNRADDRIRLEPWMFNPDKWRIKHRTDWEEEPVEEPSEVEDWMLHFEPVTKQWLKNQNFYIL